MIVLSESSEQIELSASSLDIKTVTEAAKLLGCKVYYIPPDFDLCDTAENALYHIPKQDKPTPGVWVGYIPSTERYEAIYKAALIKGIKLLNNPIEHQTVTEFDRFYLRLQGLTPESLVINSSQECLEAVNKLGFPVFIKGSVQSRKSRGWKACVANNEEETIQITQKLLNLKFHSRGKVILRKLLNLRHTRKSAAGFPLGREFRCFIYNNRVLEYGYYWEGEDELSKLLPPEEKEVLSLAVTASKRIGVPYIAIDIGQLNSGEWIVIEVGDAQFTGLSQIPALNLWNKIKDITL